LDRKASMSSLGNDSKLVTGFKNILSAFIEAVQHWEGFEKYAKKLDRWDRNRAVDYFTAVGRPMENGFYVLCHGDAWINNLMFKLNEANNPEDVLLIDYQVAFWGSPAFDVSYFLTNSVADEFKTEHYDEFIEFYHETLVESLAALKNEKAVPTLDEIHIDILKNGFLRKLSRFLIFIT